MSEQGSSETLKKWSSLFTCCKRRASLDSVTKLALHYPSIDQWRHGPTEYCFQEESHITVGLWSGSEKRGYVKKPWKQDPCKFAQLSSFLSQENVQGILENVQASAKYEDYLDSVDHRPVFEYYLVSNGQWQDEVMKRLLHGFVVDQLLPYVRERFACSTITLDQVLVRRYVPGERRTLGLHFDVHAYVTAVLGLSDPCDYSGGLYLQPEADASSRTFFRIEPGDLVVHSFDLEHGVFMWSGFRYSIIFWLKDSPEAVSNNTSPWYDKLIANDNPDAIYNVAQDSEMGIFGRPQDMQKAIALYERSAALGHHFAQYRLGLLLHLQGDQSGRMEEYEQGSKWIRTAAEQGFAPAQKTYGLILASGAGVTQDYKQAAIWMRRAADQLDEEAANHLAELYMKGLGVPRNKNIAAQWYTRSAESGFPQAQYLLGTLYAKGAGVSQDVEQAMRWFKLAASQGSSKARRRLIEMTQRGN